KFDLTFTLNERVSDEGEPQGVRGYVEYSADLFERETVAVLAARLVRLLKAAVATPQARVRELEIMEGGERQRVLEGVHVRLEERVAATTLTELFEGRAGASPEAEALSFQEQRLAYGELNRRANRLAHWLIGEGVGAESLVGIALERSPEMVIAIVATLKAGAAYLPLDPDYPRPRLEYMLQDARPHLVLTAENLRAQLPQDTGVRLVCLDAADFQASLASLSTHNPSDAERILPLQPEHAAYVIYTSGSAGMPMRVVVTQQNVTRLFAAARRWFNFGSEDVWTLFHSHAFDFSVWEMWGAWLYGGRLVVVSRPVTRSPGEFLHLLVQERVTVLN